MIEGILALVCTTGLWLASVRDYVIGHRHDWALLAVGTVAALTADSLAAWDLFVGHVGRSGGIVIAVSIVVVITWSSGMAARFLRGNQEADRGR